jgi:hypothetical protein
MYRNAADETVAVDRVKLIEFAAVAELFPQVPYARQERIQVNRLRWPSTMD